MAKETTFTKAARCIEAISKIRSSMAEDSNSSKTVISIKENTKKANHMDTENIPGQAEMCILAFSPMAHAQAKEH